MRGYKTADRQALYFFLKKKTSPTQGPMLMVPEALLGSRILAATLTPLPSNENSPLATTGGGLSVRIDAPHETLTTVLSRIDNTTAEVFANPCQSPLKSNVAGET
jgi:hypothetical protein